MLNNLLKCFGCKKAFKADGRLTNSGAIAYNKLIWLLYAIGETADVDVKKIVNKLDEMCDGGGC